MEVLQTIIKETITLKEKISCNSCKSTEISLNTPCGHNFCNSCLKNLSGICSQCKQPFFLQDCKEDLFSPVVLQLLENIIDTNSCETKDEPNFLPSCQNIVIPDELKGYKIRIKSDTKRNPKGESLLHIACKKNNIQSVLEHIKNGVDINARDYAGWAPLHEAVERGNIECVKCLLQEGALPNIPGASYVTPLHKAVSLNNYEIVDVLLKYGADPNAIDYSGKTAIDLCTSPKILSILKNPPEEIVSQYSLFVDSTLQIFIDVTNKNKNYSNLTSTSLNIQMLSLEALKEGKVSHYVLTKPAQETNLLHLVYSLIQGASVVSERWLSVISDKNDYLGFDFITHERKESIKKSVINKLHNNPKLFDGINFYFTPTNKPHVIMDTNFSMDDLTTLASLGGGKLLSRCPALRTVENQFNYPFHVDKTSDFAGCFNFIIYDKNKPSQLLYNMKELKHKSSEWMIECILNFSIIS